MIRADRPVLDRRGLEQIHGLSPSQAHRQKPWNRDGHPKPINNPGGRRGPLWDEEQVQAFVAGTPVAELPVTDAGSDLLEIEEFAALIGVETNTLSRYVAREQAPAPDKTIHGTAYWYRSTVTGWERPGAGAGAGRRAGPERLSPAELRERARATIDAWPKEKLLGARALARELEISPTTASEILRELQEAQP